jgi:hypothetical protein
LILVIFSFDSVDLHGILLTINWALSMASNSSNGEHQGSLISGVAPDETSPLLRVDSSNSKISVSASTTKLLATEETADIETSEIRQKDSTAAVISLLLIGKHPLSFTFVPVANDFHQASSPRMQMVRWYLPQRQRSHRIIRSWNPQVGFSRAMHSLKLLHSPCSQK